MKTINEQAKEFSKFDSETNVATDLGSYRQGLFEGYIKGYSAALQEVEAFDQFADMFRPKMIDDPERPHHSIVVPTTFDGKEK